MPTRPNEILVSFIIGTIIILVFLLFLLIVLILYIKRKMLYEKEKVTMKALFDHEILKTQLETQEQTFSNISRELHDNIGQLLNSTKLLIGISQRKPDNALTALATADETLAAAINELRSLSKLLNKDYLQQFDFFENLQAEVNRINASGILKINFLHPPKFFINNDEQIVLFRIVQEALQNAIKHSEATIIDIHILAGNNGFSIVISDNGKGFQRGENKAAGIGLSNMKQRTLLLGGEIEWESQEGSGTIVQIRIPIKVNS